MYYSFSEAFEAQLLVPHPVTWKIVAVDLIWKNVLEVKWMSLELFHASQALNVNLGVLGHIDSGKTSICRWPRQFWAPSMVTGTDRNHGTATGEATRYEPQRRSKHQTKGQSILHRN